MYSFRRCFSLGRFGLVALLMFSVFAGCESMDMQDYEIEAPSAEEVSEAMDTIRSHFPGFPERTALASGSTEEKSAATPAEPEDAARIERTLQEGSLDELARLRPQAEAMLQEMRRYEWAQLWADWLLARLDYLDLANEALARARAQVPTRPGEPPPTTPAESEVARKAAVIISDRGAWMRRLANRPPPARAQTYVDDAKAIFAAEGVAPQWVWLAEVESSWNPEALSPAGARGLFQLMPATADYLGLALKPEDERLHPEKNTRAAARYLRRLYDRFGSWPLTLAAYNAGEGRVSRLLARQGQPDERTFAAIASALPTETQMYVPRVLATVQLREGVDPLTLPAPGSGQP